MTDYRCMQYSVPGLRRRAEQGNAGGILIDANGRPLTDAEIVAACDEWIARGFGLVPCAHADEHGVCRGVPGK